MLIKMYYIFVSPLYFGKDSEIQGIFMHKFVQMKFVDGMTQNRAAVRRAEHFPSQLECTRQTMPCCFPL